MRAEPLIAAPTHLVAPRRALLLGAILLSACGGGGDLLLPGTGDPATVTLLQGNGQNGRVGDPLPQPLVAEVLDNAGRPVAGATVVFVLTDPAPGASLTPDRTTTGADGTATAQVVLGTRTGAQNGEVQALGAQGQPAATAPFTLTAVAENANGITAVGGMDQSGQVGTTLASPLVVQVADAFGNPIAGVAVAWSADGGGSVSSETTTTGDDGLTSVTRTLGTAAGTQRTLASVDGLAGSPVTFVHTATAGAASGLTIVSGDDQQGPVSTELPLPLVVQVKDGGGNAVAGVAVSWVIGAGGGSVTPTTSTTDAAGQATAAWTLGGAPGPNNTVSAVVSGIGVVEFSATATAGAPARLSVRTQPSPNAVSGVPLGQQPVIQLLDAGGNEAPQGGVAVTVAINSGGGTLGGTATRATDGNGRATFTDLVITGAPGNRTLKFSATGFAAVTSAQITLAAAPTVTTITSDSPDPSRTGVAVTVQFTVSSASGTPTGSVQVKDGGDTCTGTLSGGQGSCSLPLNTAGSRTLTATYTGTNGFGNSNDTEPHTVEAPPPPVLTLAVQPPAEATSGVALDPQPVVQLKTGDGADLATAGVTVTVAIGDGGPLAGPVTAVTDAQGRATFTGLIITGDPGTRTLNFSAPGFEGVSSNPITVLPVPTTTTILGTDPSGTAKVGTPVTVTFAVNAVAGTPTGTVTVTSSLGSSACSDAVAIGRCTLASLPRGTQTLIAAYPATGRFSGSSGTAAYEVTTGNR